MKLITFQVQRHGKNSPQFGFLDEDVCVPLPHFVDALDYLNRFPHSEKEAKAFRASSKAKDGVPLKEVKLLPPIPNPPMLLDFSLAPRHLEKAVETLLKYEYGPITRWIMKRIFRKNAAKRKAMGMLDYYKANHLAVSGEGDEVFWPDYTEYLDFECELGVVIGTREAPIAGYLILNDWSARDVQMPEMFSLSLTRSKDFAKSYGLGPWLVTPEEIPDPLALGARAQVFGKFDWRGHTSEYSVHPREAVSYLQTMFEPAPGTVFGMGTIPGLCGLEHDLWIAPGDEVRLSIDGLGTLTQRVSLSSASGGRGNDRRLSRWK